MDRGCVVQRAVERGTKSQKARFFARQPNDDHLVRGRRKHLALEQAACRAIGNARNGCIQIQLAAIVRCAGAAVNFQEQIAERLVRLVVRTLHLFAKRVSFMIVFVVEHEPAYIGENGACIRIIPVVGSARPEGVFVELQAFGIESAEHHGTQASIPDGKRVGPGWCRLPVPKNVFV